MMPQFRDEIRRLRIPADEIKGAEGV